MLFFKRTLPLIITALTGIAFALQYYVPHPSSEKALSEASRWLQIISGFAILLGVFSLCHVHYQRIQSRKEGWGYSLIVYVSMVITLVAGFWAQDGPALSWIYVNVFSALQATMFSILAFFVASAAYHAFRARTLQATVLLVAATVVMFGRVPLGEALLAGSGLASDWIMSVWNTAARRAILIGISLGAIATSIKIIFGIERGYLGGGKD
jgi:cell division protein FtsW (lipid II flippase)